MRTFGGTGGRVEVFEFGRVKIAVLQLSNYVHQNTIEKMNNEYIMSEPE